MKRKTIRLSLKKPIANDLDFMVTLKGKIIYVIFILFHCCLLGYAQQTRYSYSFKDADLSEVVKEVSHQAKINILYNPNILRTSVKISGDFRNLTVTQALDTFLRNTQVTYKLFKKDIVLFKKNEEIKENHKITQPVNVPRSISEKSHPSFTDTIIYSLITHDTVVTTLTDYVKIQVKDTVKVYDTIEVIRKIIKPITDYRPRKKAYVVGISSSIASLFPTFKTTGQGKDFEATLKSSYSGKNSRNIALNFLYLKENLLIETGLGITTNTYNLNYREQIPGFVIYKDTIDKYYTVGTGMDTTWVYVTQDRRVETNSTNHYSSEVQCRYITLPLLIGYPLIKRNLTMEFKGGVIFNYFINSRGYYLNIGDTAISVESKKLPGAWLNIGVMGATAFDYYLNEKIHVYAQAFANWDALPIRQKNVFQYATNLKLGLQIGIRYFF
ncbi:MAG TPA: STN domain-containing protein [Bacteroidales bacterium]